MELLVQYRPTLGATGLPVRWALACKCMQSLHYRDQDAAPLADHLILYVRTSNRQY